MLHHESQSAGILPHRLWIRLTPLMFRNREQAYQLWLNFAFTATFRGFDENTPTVDSYTNRMLRTRGKI